MIYPLKDLPLEGGKLRQTLNRLRWGSGKDTGIEEVFEMTKRTIGRVQEIIKMIMHPTMRNLENMQRA